MTEETTILTSDQAIRIAFGENCLLDALGPEITLEDLPGRLANAPLDEIPWRSVPLAGRYQLVRFLRSHFVPTPTAIEIALSLQRTLRMGYIERNPRDIQQRQKLSKISGFRNSDITELPWFPTYASGTVIKGITGLGKSTMVKRVFDLFPKFKDHGENVEGCWLALKQITHITVSMAGDQSRAGFLLNILSAVDIVAETHYYEQYSNKTGLTVEKLMVIVVIVLSNHRCGYLIIDEIQKRNFFPGESRALLLLFFLRLLNVGIPLLLIGNPEGFLGFESFTQDTRRLYSDGCFELWPADSIDDIEYFDDFVDGKCEFNLIGPPLVLDTAMKIAILKCTAGIHGYFDLLYEIMHDNAIRSGRTQFEIDDVQSAYMSSRMAPHRVVIDALSSRDPLRLLDFEDISEEAFSVRWGIDLKEVLARANTDTLAKAAIRHSKPRKPRQGFAEMERKFASASTDKSDKVRIALKNEAAALSKMLKNKKKPSA